jgi:hypothetical protein
MFFFFYLKALRFLSYQVRFPPDLLHAIFPPKPPGQLSRQKFPARFSRQKICMADFPPKILLAGFTAKNSVWLICRAGGCGPNRITFLVLQYAAGWTLEKIQKISFFSHAPNPNY